MTHLIKHSDLKKAKVQIKDSFNKKESFFTYIIYADLLRVYTAYILSNIEIYEIIMVGKKSEPSLKTARNESFSIIKITPKEGYNDDHTSFS